ncbi:MAG: hypothetical protein CMK89_19210 [Pseudomonadales bacterium]|nr:hypothetical protein [Pseudomonadales bacterium]
MYKFTLRCLVIAAWTFQLAGCFGGNKTSITLESDVGDYIGQGSSYSYSQENAIITTNVVDGLFSIRINGDQSWSGFFALPEGYEELQPGSYPSLTRYPFHDPAVGGLSWYGEGRGCNRLNGWIIINKVTYQDGLLTAIELEFEQHCEGGTPALHGEVKWYAADDTMPPGPEQPIPDTLWQPNPELLPESGNYVYLLSEPGDYIGGGQESLHLETESPITVSTGSGYVSFDVAGWLGRFQAMSGLEVLETGYYGDLQRFPFHNPAKGGLSWSGNGRGCNRLSGWFAVDSVSYVGGVLSAIDMRFEQHCEGNPPALLGKIHWSR